ncbi:hypothetical protein M0D69_37580 [Caballeronia sp. SEWSISQ10-4 2]|uniref:hypothetical protein n=1 Tax=Caballeronia sp. SEWSISQ10-4 2 TaxID=2937438 RepID=UPI00264BA1D6|nr:hypothetical protein [Caballeronia sp. SEWSISQ10-4 2]MDN7183624.1 hypothetical protein [Caballeronia sp. SEWSISQ10-4 2]
MDIQIAERYADVKTFARYQLEHNTKRQPIGIERGLTVTTDLVQGLPTFNVKQYFGSQPTIFDDYDHVVTAYSKDDGRVVSLIGARWLGDADFRFLYLWTAMVADEYRNSGVFRRSLAYFFERVANSPSPDPRSGGQRMPPLIVTKTYNPVVYRIFSSFARAGRGVELYPLIPAEQQPETLVTLAKKIAYAISPKMQLIEQTGVVLGGQALVAPDFFPLMEESKDEDVNRHFQQHVSRADQVLCILRIPDSDNGAVLSAVTAALR